MRIPFALILAAGAAFAEEPRIPILAWIGIPAEHTSPERYEEMAAAGFTLAFQGYPNLDSLIEALDTAHGAGIQLIAGSPELRQDPAGTVRRIKDHPALYGYALRDEPGAELFPMLAEWVAAIHTEDDTRWCYINLFPNYASPEQLGTDTYREHVRLFLDTVPQPVLSFDHYPVIETPQGIVLRPQYYENLRIIAEEAARAGIPFWAFALSVAHDPYPIPTEAHLRLQQFSNLLYGAQGLQYFTYWTPTPTPEWNFHSAPIEQDGTRVPLVYDRVQAVTAYLQTFAPVFVGATVKQVGHLGDPIPPAANPFEMGGPIGSIDTAGAPVLVSHLVNHGREYLCILNTSLDEAVTVSVAFTDGTGAEPLRGNLEEPLAPADIRVFVWKP